MEILVKKALRCQNHPGRAKPALDRSVTDEGRLQGMKHPVGQSLYHGHRFTAGF
jgi:hypothetical protein